MAILYASHAQKGIDARNGGPVSGAHRGDSALAITAHIISHYTVTGTEAAGDVIKLVSDLPGDITPMLALSQANIPTSAATTFTGNLGKSIATNDLPLDSAERTAALTAASTAYGTGIALGGAAGSKSLGNLIVEAPDNPTGLQFTLTSVAGLNAGAKIEFLIACRTLA